MFKKWHIKRKYTEGNQAISDDQTLEPDEKVIATSDGNCFYKIIREISNKTSSELESSTIPLWTGQLYMHYWDDSVPEDYNNPEWQNQGLYFWLAEEDFPNKSLPPAFEKKSKRFFRITNEVKIFSGRVIPWFGMPGGGLKMGFGDSVNPTPISIINQQGNIDYIEIVELSDDNLEILKDRYNYTLIAASNIEFKNNIFYLDGNVISLSLAYSIGVINIAKITHE